MALNSALYRCSVMHHRLKPKRHGFRYSVFMFYLDLDELDGLHRHLPFFSRNRWNLYSFRDDDHLPEPQAPTSLRERLAAYLEREGVTAPLGRVMLLTNLRVLGYVFNPVSFYFCQDADGEPLAAVAEVGNTFHEMKPYVVETVANDPQADYRSVATKHFYVSPFSDLTFRFDFRLKEPDAALQLHVDVLDEAGAETVLVSSLTGTRRPLNAANLLALTLRFPLVTLGVITLIHWHALLLFLKRIPFHRKEANPHLQREVLRPRSRNPQESPS